MKTLFVVVMSLFCCGVSAQEWVGYVPVVVNQPVVVTHIVPTVQWQPVRIVPVVQPVVQNVAVPVIYTGNWPNVIVRDTFFRTPCWNKWVREYHYGY